MALTWKLDNDARQVLGFSTTEQPAQAVPASADYPTGGYALTAATFGLAHIRDVIITGIGSSITAVSWVWIYNFTTGKLQAFGTGASALAALGEAAANTDLSAFTVRVNVKGY